VPARISTAMGWCVSWSNGLLVLSRRPITPMYRLPTRIMHAARVSRNLKGSRSHSASNHRSGRQRRPLTGEIRGYQRPAMR
jgi:hypothetical protein